MAVEVTGPAQRRDPVPLTRGWEAPLAGVAVLVVLLAGAALLGVGVAAALAGGGWVWPHDRAAAGRLLTGLLRGRPAAGLPAAQATRLPGTGVVYAGVAGVELLAVTVAAAVGLLFARHRLAGGAGSGMASRGDAEQALGVSQLHAARRIIRPDLHPPRSSGRRGQR